MLDILEIKLSVWSEHISVGLTGSLVNMSLIQSEKATCSACWLMVWTLMMAMEEPLPSVSGSRMEEGWPKPYRRLHGPAGRYQEHQEVRGHMWVLFPQTIHSLTPAPVLLVST